jgi:flagellar hook assembly protein FlgD
VRLEIVNVLGQRVRTLAFGTTDPGPHTATWDACDQAGQRVAGGTYFVRLQAGGDVMTRKVVFLGD